jgi:hypothetical protein
MSCPETAQNFTVAVYRNSHETEKHRSSSKNVHYLSWSVGRDPVVSEVTQAIEDKVLILIIPYYSKRAIPYLEEHVHDKQLIARITERVKAVRNGRDCADKHANHHHALEESAKRGVGSDFQQMTISKHTDGTPY